MRRNILENPNSKVFHDIKTNHYAYVIFNPTERQLNIILSIVPIEGNIAAFAKSFVDLNKANGVPEEYFTSIKQEKGVTIKFERQNENITDFTILMKPLTFQKKLLYNAFRSRQEEAYQLFSKRTRAIFL